MQECNHLLDCNILLQIQLAKKKRANVYYDHITFKCKLQYLQKQKKFNSDTVICNIQLYSVNLNVFRLSKKNT